MKKTAVLAIAVAFLLASAAICMAKTEAPKTGTSKAHKGEMMEKGCDKWHHERHMPWMMSKQMVATSDGGVIVTIGNKLYKYDSNLNLQKEVEIPFDMKAMKKMWMEKKEMGMMHEPMGKSMEKQTETMPMGGMEKK